MPNNSLPTLFQQYVHLSRYSRWIEENKKRESFEDTLKRYYDYLETKFTEFSQVRKELEETNSNLEVFPSMRGLMTAGPALERDPMAIYNCSFVAVNKPTAFDEIMYVLMLGTGVGFSVERQHVNKLPEIASEFHPTDTTIIVPDSRTGWCKSFKELIHLLYGGNIPRWDTSKVRGPGERLKTFGGRASGPEPLEELFRFTVSLFKNAAGRKLSSIECHDLVCKIASVIVVGGVRRSALISLSNLSDDRMRIAKSGQWWVDNVQRALANNSAAYTEKPDMGIFMKEWLSLYESKSGERGIFNRYAIKKKFEKDGMSREYFDDMGLNPCVPYETPILTRNGYRFIGDTIGETIHIWNGKQWSEVTPFSTGVNPTIRVLLSDGAELRCTPAHKFVLAGNKRIEAQNLKIGDKLEKYEMPIVEEGIEYGNDDEAYSQGFYSGDGNTNSTHSWLYETKFACEKRLIGTFGEIHPSSNRKTWKHGEMKSKNWVPIDGSLSYCLNWLSGLIDSDGTVTFDKDGGQGFQITSTNKGFLDSVKLMLTRMGVQAKISLSRKSGTRSSPDGRDSYKDYECQDCWRLLFSYFDSWKLVKQLGMKLERVQYNPSRIPNRDVRRFITVVGIVKDEPCETFCFTEPTNNTGTFNGIVTGQCAEIILRPDQLCNLSECVVRPTDTLETLKEKVRKSTIIGTFQSMFTDFRYVNKKWKKNCEEERLLGVSLTGIMDHVVMSGQSGKQELISWLKELRKVARETNNEWADKLGIPRSAAITCVKPSGTLSSLVDSAAGIHPRHSEYYIRSVRNDKKDPLSALMIDEGIPYEEDVTNPSNWVFYFPIKSPDGAITRKNISAIEHLEVWKCYRQYWCDHNPSITVSVKEEEWMDVGAWVYENFDEICGISFLPYSDHVYKQAPYMDCTKEEYEELYNKMPKEIDWNKLSSYEVTDSTTSSKELSCAAGGCDI